MAKKEVSAQPTLRPLEDRVVIEVLNPEQKTSGGILLPDSAQQKPQQGKIIAAGPGKMLDGGTRAALSVQVGDLVLFGKYSGSDVEIHGRELKIMRESEILGKLVK